jgi:predicted ferric reductase
MPVVVVLSLIPVVIWAFMEPLGLRFFDLNSVTTGLGQICGLVGMALFSINLILSGRFKFLDKYFKGLDKVYANHSKIGSIAFSLILFHPLFLVVKYLAISTQEAALFFVPFTNAPITWGIISLVLMIILMCLTFYFKIKYNIWKISHKFMVMVFLFAIFHTLVISSDISRNGLLRYYILILAIVGLAVSIHQAFLNKFISKKFKYKVKNVNKLNESVTEIEMEPLKRKMNFNPGQFAFFSFLSGWVSSESHPFSISSSAKENNLKITVKNLGDYTDIIKNLKLNEKVSIDGPYGNFSYKNVQSKNQIWVAGGIGLTPFLSMAKSIENGYNVDLYYSVKEGKEAVYLRTIHDIAQKNPDFKFNLWITSERGYINGGAIASMSKSLAGKDIFLCGPYIFMESLKNQFVSLGVDINKIHYESFSF